MKNLFYLTIIAFFLVNIEINANNAPFAIRTNTVANISTAVTNAPEQVLVNPRGQGKFSFKCDCDAVIVIQRGIDIRTGRPYIKEWVRLPGDFRFHELKLEDGAATNPALVLTCPDVCNGNLPLID